MPEAPSDSAPDWLLHWQGHASARAAARVLSQVGHVVVLAGADAQDLPPPLPGERMATGSSADVQGHLIRRGIARAVAAQHLGGDPQRHLLVADARGAPRFGHGRLHVSFSARGEQGAIALGLGPLGVDLEPALPSAGIAWNVLRADERAALEALPARLRDEAFLRLWRAKEAVLKAIGLGFALPPETVRINADHAGIEGHAQRFSLHHAAGAGVCLARA